ncbi:hypothetical protein [Desulforamulus reducens]|uniref:hypothetical protein n=1 Tax=Desulforamulus reducens TaxID=59610 RepID=UPI0012EA5920|nr:hypothetical protein [Desulforamulus reducens]
MFSRFFYVMLTSIIASELGQSQEGFAHFEIDFIFPVNSVNPDNFLFEIIISVDNIANLSVKDENDPDRKAITVNQHRCKHAVFISVFSDSRIRETGAIVESV